MSRPAFSPATRAGDTPGRQPAAVPPGRPPPPATLPGPWSQKGTSVIGYLPAAIVATFAVAVLPALLAAALIPARGVAGTIATLACAVALSLGLAGLGSASWQRLHGARGVVFSDLMLWGFARRLWAERRLRRIGAAYAGAVAVGRWPRVELLEGLSRLLETRNPYTAGHCRRVARHAERIARAMHLGPAEVAEIRAAALIHDVGKVYTPAAILHKSGPLTGAEFETIKRHAIDGADMLAPVRDGRLAAIVRHHHERIDGSGYPDGLAGAQIPLGARIIAVADTFDAITSRRPYRPSRSQHEGLEVLEREAGRRLDGDAVAAFVDVYTPQRAIASVSLSAAIWARLAPAELLRGWLLGGGAQLAALLPAAGAAGLLAVAPAGRYEKSAAPAEERGRATASALQARFPAALTGSPPAVSRPVLRIGPTGVRRSYAGAPAVKPGPLVPVGPRLLAPAPAPVRAGEIPGRASELPRLEVHVPPAENPTTQLPTVTTPPIATPPVATPPVSTPPVTTPAIAIPGITVAPATLPSVTAGSGGVTVEAIGTPRVKLEP